MHGELQSSVGRLCEFRMKHPEGSGVNSAAQPLTLMKIGEVDARRALIDRVGRTLAGTQAGQATTPKHFKNFALNLERGG